MADILHFPGRAEAPRNADDPCDSMMMRAGSLLSDVEDTLSAITALILVTPGDRDTRLAVLGEIKQRMRKVNVQVRCAETLLALATVIERRRES